MTYEILAKEEKLELCKMMYENMNADIGGYQEILRYMCLEYLQDYLSKFDEEELTYMYDKKQFNSPNDSGNILKNKWD